MGNLATRKMEVVMLHLIFVVVMLGIGLLIWSGVEDFLRGLR